MPDHTSRGCLARCLSWKKFWVCAACCVSFVAFWNLQSLGLRHDSRTASQMCGERGAYLRINRWYLFGNEIYRDDRMVVLPSWIPIPEEIGSSWMRTEFTDDEFASGHGIMVQKRICGFPVGKQDDLF